MKDKPYRGIKPADLAVKKGILNSLERIGADLTGKAQRMAPKAPVAGGKLRESGDWEIPGGSSFMANQPGAMDAEIFVRVIFDVRYARKQHEELSYRHTNGQAKYLEKPLKDNALKYEKEIEAAINHELRTKL